MREMNRDQKTSQILSSELSLLKGQGCKNIKESKNKNEEKMKRTKGERFYV